MRPSHHGTPPCAARRRDNRHPARHQRRYTLNCETGPAKRKEEYMSARIASTRLGFVRSGAAAELQQLELQGDYIAEPVPPGSCDSSAHRRHSLRLGDSDHTSIHMSIHMSIHNSYTNDHTSVHMSIRNSLHNSLHRSTHRSIHMSIHNSIHRSVHMLSTWLRDHDYGTICPSAGRCHSSQCVAAQSSLTETRRPK